MDFRGLCVRWACQEEHEAKENPFPLIFQNVEK